MKTPGKIHHSKTSSLKIPALLILSVLLLGSCQKPSNSEQVLLSAVNVVNATIDMPQVAFSINKIQLPGAPLSYMDETGYFITFPGTRDFDVRADGIIEDILKTRLDFKENTYHTLFITGTSTSLATLFTEDDLNNPPAGKAKIRFVHLSPDGGNLILTLKNGTALFPEQAYKTASEFTTIDPGGYTFELKTPAGAIMTEKNVTIIKGGIYTIMSNGMKAGAPNFPLGLHVTFIN